MNDIEKYIIIFNRKFFEHIYIKINIYICYLFIYLFINYAVLYK